MNGSGLIRIIAKHGIACLSVAILTVCIASFVSVAHALPAQSATENPVPSIVDALRSRQFDRALQQSESALVKSPRDYRLMTLRGMAYSGLGKQSLALTSFQGALKLSPQYLPALEGAAQIEYQKGSQAARPLLLRVLALQPADPTSHAMLGALDFKAQNCAGAVDHFQQAAATIASQPDVLTEYGSCLAVLKRYDEAITILRQTLAIEPGRRVARYNLALAQWNNNQPADALSTLSPIIDAPPSDQAPSYANAGDEEALTLAADICEANNDTPRAVELLRKAILAQPKNVAAYIEFADLSYNHASMQVGIDMINAGLTQLPGEAQLYLVRGILLSQLGNFEKAMEDLDTANRLNPTLSFTGVAQGLVQSQQHKSSAALASFRLSAKTHPDNALAQYLLAEALSQEGKPQGSPEYTEEVAAANRAVKLDPKLLAAHGLLASIYLQDGRTQLAIHHCEAALAIDPNDQQALYHLILALRKTDRKDELPALLKRLNEVRGASRNEGSAKMRYQLVEGTPASATAP